MPGIESRWDILPSAVTMPSESSNHGTKLIWLIALLPALFVLTTWDSDGILTNQNALLRHFSLPVVAFEIAIVWLAAKAGFELKRTFLDMPQFVKWALCIWLFFAVFAAVGVANDVGTAVFVTMRYLLQGMVFAAVIFLVSHERFDHSRWIGVLTVGAMVYLFALVAFISLIPNPDKFDWVSALPSATNVRQIGNNLALLAIAPVVGVLARKSPHRVLYFVALAAIICFIGWTGSRGGLFGIFAGVVAGLVLTAGFTKLRHIGLMLLSLISGLLASIPLFSPAPEFGVLRIASSISRDDASSGRIEMWINALAEIAKMPLTGHGSGSYREHMFEITGFAYNHPHNFILQFAFDWGVVGALAMILILTTLGWHLVKLRNRHSPARFASVAGFSTVIAIAMIEGTLFHPLPIFIGMALIAPALAGVGQDET